MNAPAQSPELVDLFDAQSWEAAGRLLVAPPPHPRGEPSTPLPELLEALLALQRPPDQVGPEAFPLADLLGLGRLLLHRPWSARDRELLRQAADQSRRELVGDTVTYVVNRNINATNHCVLRCGFCAFRRSPNEAGAFRLNRAELLDRAAQAQALGATELCLQAGLDPEAQSQGSHLHFAAELLRDLKAAAPELHLHGFSPQELLFVAQRDNVSLRHVVETLREAGLGSVPGTAAEVLCERVRRLICPEKLSAQAWVAVMMEVHQAGLRSTSTLLAGHVETAMEQLAHLCTLAAVQHHARLHNRQGFTEFIVLPFVGAAAPAPLRARVGRDQPDPDAMLLLTAQSRLLLGAWIRHHQPSWVKLTLPIAAEALAWGCDDLGGTLMEEHITTMAGAAGGTSQTVDALRAAAMRKGRPVRQRTTLYGACAAPC
ncbi:MAG: CofH family radical SAM protein [Cyanobacteriota bacterium]|nr:CofH family radical SAM protein [Cyanobacteriota bacterium]